MNLRALIKEFVLLELDKRRLDNPEMLADDSLDLAIDKSLESFDRQAKEGGEFSPDAFATAIARFVDHATKQLDISGAITRRAINHISKSYDPEKAKEVKRVLADDFDLHADPTVRSGDVDDSLVPTASLGGPPPTGGPGG